MAKPFYIVGIGASAGGLRALSEFFRSIPKSTPAAFVVITHLLRENYSQLANLLIPHSTLPVIRVESDLELQPGHIYVLIENTTLTVKDGWLKIADRDRRIMNDAVDLFFKSLATEYKERAIGIILSGGGKDGLAGALQLNLSGGTMMVQTPLSADFVGMPESIINHDHPLAVLNPTALAEKVIELLSKA